MQYRSSLLLAALLTLGGAPAWGLSLSPERNPSGLLPMVARTDMPTAGRGMMAGAGAIATSPDSVEASIDLVSDTDAEAPGAAGNGEPAWLWWLIPLALLGAVAWGLTRRKGDDAVQPSASAEPQPPTAPSASDAPVTEAESPDTGPEAPGVTAGASLGGVTPAVDAAGTMGTANGGHAPAEPVAPPQPPSASTPTSENGGATSHRPPTRPGQGAGGTSFAGAAGLAAGAASSLASTEDQSAIEASKYNVVGRPADGDIDLSSIDDGLPDLPGGYGESRIVLMPRDPQWAYVYWDIPNQHKESLRRQGGSRLALRLYDVTGIDINQQASHSMLQHDCDELARSWYLPIPISDRNYLVEIGYLTPGGDWLMLARSNAVHIPPVYPSSWEEELFATVAWEQDLRDETLTTLLPPDRPTDAPSIHAHMAALSQGGQAQRMAGSLFGSMQHVPGSLGLQPAVSSYRFPSGVGMEAVPTVSGLTPSGMGFSASAPPLRPRKFWLVADAELIVYGATEPDATVTIGGQPIQLQPDGTFRFHMSFQDGTIDYPILAVAADGEQARSVHMTFDRKTPQRHTNTQAEAQEEWPDTGEA